MNRGPSQGRAGDLDDFDASVRQRSLAGLALMAQRREVPVEPMREVANMHAHTFFGYNTYGLSPEHVAWLARRHGIRLVGKVDFDVLSGIDEFLAACDLLGLRGTAGIETRVFVRDLADVEINSPGEPGVCYHMGVGFVSSQLPAEVAPVLAGLRQRAEVRNRDVMARVNAFLAPVVIDYEQDVLPLTPAGNATERHMVAAYAAAAVRTVADPAAFWADRLALPLEQMRALVEDTAEFHALIRARLMKRGGVGYVQPGPGAFATVEEFHRLVTACGAVPCACWLDGGSPGEQDPEALLAMWIHKGVVVQNVIPEYARKRPDDMRRLVQVAEELALPLNVGTEMNSPGQKLLDEFDAPDLAPLRKAFLDGAYCVYGHTALQRELRLGYLSEWAQAYLPERRARNEFYTQVGRLVPPGARGVARLRLLAHSMSPQDVLARLVA